jgi:hypothetical protein
MEGIGGRPVKQPGIGELANAVSAKLDADVILFNSPIRRPFDANLISGLDALNRRKNVLVMLVTEGGDPDAAFRIGRSLQRYYENAICLVSGYCKSAGTIIAIAANELVFGPHGELGPIDVQMTKRDELYETQSGQTVMSALEMMQDRAFATFEHCFLEIQRRSFGRITVKSATEMAVRLSVGLFSPIYQQIDPMHMGEAIRASAIAAQYGARLDIRGKNLKPESLDLLMSGYTSHGFVIDEDEARKLFLNVRHVDKEEKALCEALGQPALDPSTESVLRFLSSQPKGNAPNADNQAEPNPKADQDARPRKAAPVAIKSA